MCLVSGVMEVMLDTVQWRQVRGSSQQLHARYGQNYDNQHKLPEVIQTRGGFLVVHPALAIYRDHILLDLLQLFHLQSQPSKLKTFLLSYEAAYELQMLPSLVERQQFLQLLAYCLRLHSLCLFLSYHCNSCQLVCLLGKGSKKKLIIQAEFSTGGWGGGDPPSA